MLNERGYYLTRILDDGRIVDLAPLTFGRARLLLSDSLQDAGYSKAY